MIAIQVTHKATRRLQRLIYARTYVPNGVWNARSHDVSSKRSQCLAESDFWTKIGICDHGICGVYILPSETFGCQKPKKITCCEPVSVDVVAKRPGGMHGKRVGLKAIKSGNLTVRIFCRDTTTIHKFEGIVTTESNKQAKNCDTV